MARNCASLHGSLRGLALMGSLLLAVACARTPSIDRVKINYSVADPQFERTVGSLLGPAVVGGNRITTLVNGEHIFSAMLEAIRGAQKSICLETFIFWDGVVAREFCRALSERARHGVKVHVVIDAVGGNRMDKEIIKKMKAAGVQLVIFHPLQWFHPKSDVEFDHRTHRKLLIVDGKIGFTGGVGIADEWDGHAATPKQWRDTHYRIEGPVVANLQAVFMATWIDARHDLLINENYFPPLSPKGELKCQVFTSSPDDRGSVNMQLLYALSIAAATRSIRIATAYFIPDKDTEGLLFQARKKGVNVQIIVPGPFIYYEIARKASKASWGKLLKAGVEIYEYQPTLYHCKQMIIDDYWVSIGSANLDNRSFSLNDEMNLNVLDGRFAAEQRLLFEEDLKKSKRITYEAWRKRPFHEKTLEVLASIFGSQL